MGYELLKEEKGIEFIVPLEPFAGSILLPKVTSRRDITLLGCLSLSTCFCRRSQ